MLAIAGLWEDWRAPEGEVLETFTLLTTEANECVSPVHGRMPVLLQAHHYDAWLDPTRNDPAELRALVAEVPPTLRCTAVGPHVNDPRNEGPECLHAPETEPTLFP